MRDWAGSRVRADAETVVCRDCHAPIGQTCRGLGGEPLRAFPAHPKRITDAQKKATR